MYFIKLLFLTEVIGIPIDSDLEAFSIETNDQVDLSAVINDDYDYGNSDDDNKKYFVDKSRFTTTAILNYVWNGDGKHIGYNLHFDMKFRSGNIHICMFQSKTGNGVLRISGFTDFTYKWDNCDEAEGAIVKDILESVNGITTEPDRLFKCLPRIKYILVTNENFDKSEIVSINCVKKATPFI